MEPLLAILLLTVIILLTSRFLYSMKCKGASMLPPGRMGWPIIGETLEFLAMGRDGVPEKFIQDRMKRYSSEVFKTSLLGEPMVVFCGSTGNKFLFSNEYTLVQSWWPKSFNRIFPDIISSVEEETRKMKSFLPKFLKLNSMQNYIGIMDSVAKQQLNVHWDSKDQVMVTPLAKQYAFSVAYRLFLGTADLQYISKLHEQYERISNGILSMPINFPGTPFSRAVKASKLIRKELQDVIQQRKIDVAEGRAPSVPDLLTDMLRDPDIDEKEVFPNDKDAACKISGMLLASYDAPSRTLTFLVKFLAELPDVYDKVLKEQTEIAKSKGAEELLSWEDIQQMRYSSNVVSEVLRLVPPIQGSFREALTDFTYAGFLIPKGWKIHWNTYATHRNPKYFDDPDKFDPSRFEGKGPAPFTFVPFGGGPRMCPGVQYARLEILVFLHHLIRRFRWEKVVPNEKTVVDFQSTTEHGLPVKMWPHKP